MTTLEEEIAGLKTATANAQQQASRATAAREAAETALAEAQQRLQELGANSVQEAEAKAAELQAKAQELITAAAQKLEQARRTT